MQANFNTSLDFIFKHEGGFVHNPKDPGGATNLGVTQATLSHWRSSLVTADEVKLLTKAEATSIYHALYWNVCRCPEHPPGLDLVLFDCAVNCGASRSAAFLQSLLGVKPDGVIGPITLDALEHFLFTDTDALGSSLNRWRALVEDLIQKRANYYATLPTYAEFGKGWMNRLHDLETVAHTLTA